MKNKMVLYFYYCMAEIFNRIKFCCFKEFLLTLTLKIKPQILAIFSLSTKLILQIIIRVVNYENYNPYTQPAT